MLTSSIVNKSTCSTGSPYSAKATTSVGSPYLIIPSTAAKHSSVGLFWQMAGANPSTSASRASSDRSCSNAAWICFVDYNSDPVWFFLPGCPSCKHCRSWWCPLELRRSLRTSTRPGIININSNNINLESTMTKCLL